MFSNDSRIRVKKMYMFCFFKFRVKAMYISYYYVLQNAWYAVFYLSELGFFGKINGLI